MAKPKYQLPQYRVGWQPDNLIARLCHSFYFLPPADIIGTGYANNKQISAGISGGYASAQAVIVGLAGVPTRRSVFTQPLQPTP